MVNVYLQSTFRDASYDTHWASPYHALRQAFVAAQGVDCRLVNTPEAADLILVCPRPRNPVFPLEIFRGGVAWRHRHKCVVVSTDDGPTITHKGFYTALEPLKARSPLLRGGFYPLVAFAQPPEPFPLDAASHYLFSFLGSFDTDPVRQRIGEFAEGAWQGSAPYLVVDTSARARQTRGVSTTDFRATYLESLESSQFILCPRGMCPSSLRLFETMKAARVPVVVSDDWVPPPEVPWEQFVIRVKEGDLAALPRILESETAGFAERAAAARSAWDQFFSAQAMPATLARWGMDLVREAGERTAWRHLGVLARQAVSWRFLRRGVASELRRVLSPAQAEGTP